MNLQTIRSLDGKIEYVLLPIAAYKALENLINANLKKLQEDDEYELFDPADYVDNPVALARIQAGITQEELAKLMNVSQAYISKIENQSTIGPKILHKVKKALTDNQTRHE